MKRIMLNVFVILVLSLPVGLFAGSNAGSHRTVKAGKSTALDGRKSRASRGYKITSYKWTQTSGPRARISRSTSTRPRITAPRIYRNARLTFKLRVTEKNRRTGKYRGSSD